MSLSPLNFVGFVTFSLHEECLLPRRLSLVACLKGEKGCQPNQKINLPCREEKIFQAVKVVLIPSSCSQLLCVLYALLSEEDRMDLIAPWKEEKYKDMRSLGRQ